MATYIWEGALKKKCPKKKLGRSIWQERYFAVSSESVSYFKPVEEGINGKKLGEIPLNIITDVAVPAHSKKGGRLDLVVQPPGEDSRYFSLSAEDSLMAEQLQRTIRKAQHKIDAHARKASDIMVGGSLRSGKRESVKKGKSSKAWKNKEKLDELLHRNKLTVVNEKDLEETEDNIPMLLQIRSKEKVTPFGVVYQIQNRNDVKAQYRMHAIPKDMEENKAQDLFDKMNTLNHPSILFQVHQGVSSDHIWALYQPAFDSQSSLLNLLSDFKDGFPEEVVNFFGKQLVQVLCYLHGEGHCFWNLKPENILLDLYGNILVNDCFLCLAPCDALKEMLALEYTAPEEISDKTNSPAGDWWRLGIFLYLIYVGKLPFENDQYQGKELDKVILNFKSSELSFPEQTSQSFCDFIQKLLVVNPSERLGVNSKDAQDVNEHAWFCLSSEALELKEENRKIQKVPQWIQENILIKWNYRKRIQQTSLEKAQKKEWKVSLTVKVEEAQIDIDNIDDGRNSSKKSQTKQGDPNQTVNLHCKVKYTDEKETKKCDGKKAQWNEEFTFDLKENQNDIIIRLFTTLDGSEIYIGEFNVKTREIQITHDSTMGGWYSIIDRSGMVKAQIKASFKISQTTHQPKSIEKIILDKPLNFYFNDTIENLTAQWTPAIESVIPSFNYSTSILSTFSGDGDDERKSGHSPIVSAEGRFRQDGFDLDLTYITKRIIALGAIDSKKNPTDKIIQFLDTFHKGNYKIYSFLYKHEQPDYDSFSGNGGIKEITFLPDQPPPFRSMAEFCNDAREYLEKNSDGVIVTHCDINARSNIFLSVYLLYANLVSTHQEALYILNKKRNAGTSLTSSQTRYVGYFEKYIKENLVVDQPLNFGDKTLIFIRARLMPIYDPKKYKFSPLLKVFCNGSEIECDDSADGSAHLLPPISRAFTDVITPDGTAGKPLGFTVYGDVKFELYNESPDPPVKVGSIWIHTDFVDNGYIIFPKRCIDGIHDDKNEKFPPNFKIEMFFLSPS